ncbi:MAG: histidine phosphatase family protein, partial [Desulfovibrio sp.]|nr:histidine phosphatase family protein [Desulfovibrio sp.]
MQKLYVALVGLPARGKSTLGRRIRTVLEDEGIATRIFNNGEMRRSMLGERSTRPEFYDPANAENRALREQICLRNLERARAWLAEEGQVAILDATNVSSERRALILRTLTDWPVLFVQCVNEDPLLQDLCERRKTQLPEYSGYTEEAALESFRRRISYYERIYSPVQDEPHWLCVDTTANRILDERPLDGSPYYAAIRQVCVTTWVHNLYLARHGQTEFNVEGRIGGDPNLTEKGAAQAEALARRLRDTPLEWIFTSTRRRSHATAAPVIANHPNAHVLALREFDELWAGDCEGMRYADIGETMPEVTAGRHKDKYGYCYPDGESYATLKERVQRGLRRALFLAADSPLLIVGH